MGPTRRNMLGRSAALLAASTVPHGWVPQAGAQTPTPPAGPHSLPALPYAPDANEPHIDAQTMAIHHDRHHAAYVTNLNAALRDQGTLAALPVQDLLARLPETPEAIRTALRNNAGGHANHTMFWGIMGGKGGAPTGALLAAVDRDLGGVDAMRAAFNRMGLAQFGSGWVFVTVDRDGTLALAARPNQDTPLMEGGRVLMGNDVWEHAYYLKYQNRRADYLAAWWNVVNWDAVTARYEAARAGTLGV